MPRNTPIVMKSQLKASVADNGNHQPLNQNHNTPISSFLTSPKFKGFITHKHPGNEFPISPNTILDTRPFSPHTNPSWYNKMNHLKSHPGTLNSPRCNFSETKDLPEYMDSRASIGLKLIDTLAHETTRDTSSSNVCNKRILFGSKLSVAIPQLPKAQLEFIVTTPHSENPACKSESLDVQTEDSDGSFKSLCASDIKLSEEYTCVTTHGCNPRTTHIYDNGIIESYYSLSDEQKSPSNYFLSFCHTCKKSLEQTEDIFIYRGEKAFCSHGCRNQEMLVDGVENPDLCDY